MDKDEKFYTVRGYELLQKNKKHLTSAMEDYLEMIYRSSLNLDHIHINTIAKLLNVKASSTTKMVQRLSKLNLVNYEKYGLIVLTEQGKEIGQYLLRRHEIIETLFKNLGIESILQEVELIEHTIDADTLENLNILNSFLQENSDFLEGYKNFKNKKFKKRE